MNTVLEYRNTGKSLNRIPVLKNISLRLCENTATGLFGHAGSGKTALIKAACGMMMPTMGTVLVCGEPIGVQSKKVTACVHNACTLDSERSAADLTDLYALFFADFNSADAFDMLDKLNVPLHKKLGSCDTKTMRKTQFSLALARSARLFLLDDPFSGFDPDTVSYMSGVIAAKRTEQNALLIVARDVSDVEPLINSWAFIREGEIICQNSPDTSTLPAGKTLADLYREVCPC